MEWKGLEELKNLFVDFFEKKGHLHLESFPLVPKDDCSLLFINSGMAPMKKWFLNTKTPPRKRIVTVQKCIRTPDLERVGKTDRHGTFFEMLGNFSFGDYFKREAISWAFEFVVDVLQMPIERLYVTVYKEDDEAFNIWQNEIGIKKDHIVRLGKEDNFWEIGTGPCGPCSEIYFDRGIEHGCGKSDCKPGCDCDRFIEFWNLVFSQYEHKGDGQYEEMQQKNIDTGMGLERLACIFQGVDNLFEVDTVKKILQQVCTIANVEYKVDKETDVLIRIITDHIRSITNLICDGVFPSNEGRGYVLRRLIRRAKKSGNKLKINRFFLSDLVEVVVSDDEKMKKNLDCIRHVLESEEKNFSQILALSEDKVLTLLEEKKKKFNEKFRDFSLNFGAVYLSFKEEFLSFFEQLENKVVRLFADLMSGGLFGVFAKILEEKLEEFVFGLTKYFDKICCLLEIEKEIAKENVVGFKEMENLFKDLKNSLSLKRISVLKGEEEIEREGDFVRNNLKKFGEKVEEELDCFLNCFNNFLQREDLLKNYDYLLSVFGRISKIVDRKLDFEVLKKPQVCACEAFKFCDTYGMPYDILKEMAFENGFCVDEEGFLELMQHQKKMAKSAATSKCVGWQGDCKKFQNLPQTEFVGYEQMESFSTILEIFLEEEEKSFSLAGEMVEVVLDKTPIYALSGGQIFDFGEILSADDGEILGRIVECRKFGDGQFVHRVEVLKKFYVREKVRVRVDEERRLKIQKNHTAAHILQKALILVLGEHVHQAGQLVNDKKIRFDFSHFETVSKENLKKIENLVNEVISKNMDVVVKEMEIEKARETGAIALFDEKYGDIVRVVEISNFSKEFCGGTHVKNTGEIGVFKILSESSVACGVRRIEAITSFSVLDFVEDLEKKLAFVCEILKVKNSDELEEKAKSLVCELKENRENLSSLKLQFCEKDFCNHLKESCKRIGNFKVVVFREKILNKKELRLFADCLKNKEKEIVALFFVDCESKHNILVVCGSESIKKGANANLIVQSLAELAGGKGGGKQDFAMAGLKDFSFEKEIENEFFNMLKEI